MPCVTIEEFISWEDKRLKELKWTKRCNWKWKKAINMKLTCLFRTAFENQIIILNKIKKIKTNTKTENALSSLNCKLVKCT